jgi:V8-like Glu-specific endopeptidase
MFFVALASCGSPPSQATSAVVASVLVGSDDRLELFQAPKEVRSGVGAAAAFIFGNHLRWRPDGGVTLDAPTLRDNLNVCPDEAFSAEPTAAFCSGVLLDENLVATAGHCLGDDPAATCRQMFVTFGYAYDAPGVAIELSSERVFACRNVVVVDRSDADFAVVELERPARIAPPVRSERPLAAGDALVVASYPSGLPLKVEVGATVLDAPPGIYFGAATDTFAGSSGGPLFDDAGGLVGIMTRGEIDYWFDQTCERPVRVTTSREQQQRLDPLLFALCASRYGGRPLCRRTYRCGDDVCNVGEPQTCARDCPSARCGDEVCELSERVTCAKDCSRFVDVPGSWTLPPEEYFLDGSTEVLPSGGCAFRPGTRATWYPVACLLSLFLFAGRKRGASRLQLTRKNSNPREGHRRFSRLARPKAGVGRAQR